MRLSILPVVAVIALRLLSGGPAWAASFTVDTTADDPAKTACDPAVPDDCSLRGAITAANALAEPSAIDLPAGTYELTQTSSCTRKIPGGGTTLLSGVPLCVTGTMTIQGAGAATTIVDAKGAHRGLFVSFGAEAELRGVTLTNGIGQSLPEGGGADGGNVRNVGTLRLTDSVVSNGTLPVGFGGAGGPGIYNAGTLTLLRSSVTFNIAQAAGGGGGIYNEGALAAVLTVVDSTISHNAIHGGGGGIFNTPGAQATVTGSTISGNTAFSSQGGGIYNDAALTLINSTISGNLSGSSGAGITNAQHGIAVLNDVTITDNTSGTSGGGTGGGVVNNNATNASSFTLGNTILAGNTDLAGTPPHPDCLAPASFGLPLTSAGHNLIGDATGCDLTGDLTGNISGVDPKLGALSPNGGLTETHALLADSPALDAGDPAVPGSGGAACAAIDQRGFVRPVGASCDIGAFEHLGTFAVSRVLPNRGGDMGTVAASVSGNGFRQGATVKLVRAGEEIVGAFVSVEAGGSSIATTFDLSGKARGAWDVVVTNGNAETATLTGAFQVAETVAPDLWVTVLGPAGVRPLRSATFTLIYGNHGNVDALAVPLSLSIPADVGYELYFVSPPPPHAGQLPVDWLLQPVDVLTDAQERTINMPFLLPIVPAGSAGSLSFRVTIPNTAQEGDRITLLATLGDHPYLDPDLSTETVSGFVEAARAYVQTNVDVPVPPAAVPALEQYVRDQFESMVDAGRIALVASHGTRALAYSLSWLDLDLALFAATQVLPPEQQAAIDLWRALAALSLTLGPGAAEAVPSTCPLISCRSGGVLPEGCSCVDVTCGDMDRRDCGGLPPIPIPPGCNLQAKTIKELLNNLDKCGMTKDHCEALPGHKVVTGQSGQSYCVPNKRPPNCESDAGVPNVLDTDCIGTPIKFSADPNDKSGPPGRTDGRFLVDGKPLSYTVQFENEPSATAPAQVVVVTDQLDGSKVNLDTFSLGSIAFGKHLVTLPAGVTQYTGGVDLRPEENIQLRIEAGLDKGTGLVTWLFTSIDPDTEQLTEDPDAGFLPPNVAPPEGEGSVAFSVERQPELPTGTTICNQASIVFDVNAAILTPEWCNAIDVTPPASSVQALAESQATTTFPVQWGGSDAGSGIAAYSVFVSANGGPFTAFKTDTSDASAMFTGELGKVYAFYSVASDGVGNLEAAPPTPDTLTVIGASSGPHDLAITAIKVPAKLALTAKKPSVGKTIKVLLQNRGPNNETIDDAATLASLVHVTLTSGGACPAPAAVLHAGKPQKKLPATLKKKGKLAVLFDATFDCANDAAKGGGHEDFTVSAHVNANALGEIDAHGADDDCPRQVTPPGVHDVFPDGKLIDKGCGTKKDDKTLGGPITIDVVVKP
jgi:CSLREA domain-containing protein